MITIYNEDMSPIENPDLTNGYLVRSTREIFHDAVQGVEEIWHYETQNVYPNGGKNLVRVIDVAGVKSRPAWIEKIPVMIYKPYTEEEKKAIREEKAKPSFDDRIKTLETAFSKIEGIISKLMM